MSETDCENAEKAFCGVCGEPFEIEHKLDMLIHVFTCGTDNAAGQRRSGHERYHRRKRELQQAQAARGEAV